MTAFTNSIADSDIFTFKMYEYDDLSFALKYAVNGSNEDLLNYRFEFVNKINATVIKTYTIADLEVSNQYLTKSVNLLYIGGMLNDIRARLGVKESRLICRVVHPDGQKFTHFVWNIVMLQH